MELKEGMYVRFFDGTIGKISDYYYDEDFVNGHTILLEGRDYWSCCEKGKFKTSYNLIELIEAGDYVNGVKVTEIKNGKPYHEDYNDPYFSYYFEEKDIKDIVTKEQFDSMKYEIGE